MFPLQLPPVDDDDDFGFGEDDLGIEDHLSKLEDEVFEITDEQSIRREKGKNSTKPKNKPADYKENTKPNNDLCSQFDLGSSPEPEVVESSQAEVYISPKYDIFAPPPLFQSDFFSPSTMKFFLFPVFPPLPL